jgi:hypothetical protein
MSAGANVFLHRKRVSMVDRGVRSGSTRRLEPGCTWVPSAPEAGPSDGYDGRTSMMRVGPRSSVCSPTSRREPPSDLLRRRRRRCRMMRFPNEVTQSSNRIPTPGEKRFPRSVARDRRKRRDEGATNKRAHVPRKRRAQLDARDIVPQVLARDPLGHLGQGYHTSKKGNQYRRRTTTDTERRRS